jgi:hypothetical protein
VTMRARTGIIVAVLLSLAGAANAAAPKRANSAADSTVVRKPAAKSPATRKEAVRTLDAIRIEGEIDVPQVLFITARDYRRFRDGVGTKYQVTASDVAKSVASPTRLRIVAPE